MFYKVKQLIKRVKLRRNGVYVHPTAIIDNPKYIGAGTKIWAHVHICDGAYIGESVTIGEGSYIGNKVVIGGCSRIQNHALIYEGAEIGQQVFIGPNVTITNDRYPTLHGNVSEWKADQNRFSSTLIGDYCSIGANSVIRAGAWMHYGTILGCGSVLLNSIESSNMIVAGTPAKILSMRKDVVPDINFGELYDRSDM